MKHTRLTAVLLLFALLLPLAGCAEQPAPAPESPASSDLMAGITPSAEVNALDIPSDHIGQADFAVRLLQNSFADGKNTLVSPLSVLSALAMTANGAKGDTLAEMEATLGLSADELNAYFRSLREKLAGEEDGPRFHLANSIWFTDDERFTVDTGFLQTNADFYGAGIYRAPFDDGTLREINDWVKDNTDGMIPQILDQIPEDAVMYLINALAFDGEWADPYNEYQVRPGDFTREDGTKQTVDFMRSEEYLYLEDGDAATGFIKPYKGGKYAFAALLPKEGTTVADYVKTLDGEKLCRILSSAEQTLVEAALPRFETEYSTELSEVLKAMGMPTAFDSVKADFSGLGTSTEGNIFIGRVLHKTFIAVNEQGTKAGAATAVEMLTEGAMEMPEPKRVTLDRPFVYMLIDCETNLPFFLCVIADPVA
ncbi:MAG: serpin family protein [Clostridia bacterium]|nr:serpin family protein [Clostridia bacterium]